MFLISLKKEFEEKQSNYQFLTHSCQLLFLLLWFRNLFRLRFWLLSNSLHHPSHHVGHLCTQLPNDLHLETDQLQTQTRLFPLLLDRKHTLLVLISNYGRHRSFIWASVISDNRGEGPGRLWAPLSQSGLDFQRYWGRCSRHRCWIQRPTVVNLSTFCHATVATRLFSPWLLPKMYPIYFKLPCRPFGSAPCGSLACLLPCRLPWLFIIHCTSCALNWPAGIEKSDQ